MTSPTIPELRGHVIRQLRRTVGLTQAQLATAAGYRTGGRIAVAKVEQGRAEPTPEHLTGLCEALGITPGDLDQRVALAQAEEAHRRGDVRFTDGLLTAVAGPQAAENARRLRALEAGAEELQRETHTHAAAATAACDSARDQLVVPFLELASRVHGMAAPDVPGRGAGPALSTQVHVAVQEIGNFTLNILTGIKLSTGAHRAGVAGADAVYAAVGAYATSSTGTAIASLHGAAKHAATMSWLGAGSRATNGFGMAGGTWVLRAIVGGTVALAAGSYVGAQAWVRTRRSKVDAGNLAEAEAAQGALRRELTQRWAWALEQAEILTALAAEGAGLLARLRADLGPRDEVAWGALDEPVQQDLQRALELVSAALAIEALAIWALPAAADELAPAAGVELSNAEWITAALEHGRGLTPQP